MKELIILVYKINIKNMTRQMANETMSELMKNVSLSNDEELKNNYIIKELFLPIHDGDSDVKVIYPVPQYTTSPEINELVTEISNRIKEDPDNVLKKHWEKLVRELKLIKLNG